MLLKRKLSEINLSDDLSLCWRRTRVLSCMLNLPVVRISFCQQSSKHCWFRAMDDGCCLAPAFSTALLHPKAELARLWFHQAEAESSSCWRGLEGLGEEELLEEAIPCSLVCRRSGGASQAQEQHGAEKQFDTRSKSHVHFQLCRRLSYTTS